jgi:hypothetical protein
MVTPSPASMACTTVGEMASTARATRHIPSAICRRPAATVRAQVARQPSWATVPATITVSPAVGPLTSMGEPPRAPATIPPTTAAIRPAATGAPDAMAMPSERGSATRKTTKEASRSWRRSSREVKAMHH